MELRDEDGQPFTDAHLGETFSHMYMGKDHPEAAAALGQIVVAFDRNGDEELVVLRPIVVAPDGAEVDVCPYYEAAAQPKEVLVVLTGPPEVVEQLAAAPEGYGSEASPDTGASPLAKNKLQPGPRSASGYSPAQLLTFKSRTKHCIRLKGRERGKVAGLATDPALMCRRPGEGGRRGPHDLPGGP